MGEKEFNYSNNLKILFVLSMMIIIIHRPNNMDEGFQSTTFLKRSKFDNILPRIKLNTFQIPSLTQIFNSRELYINDTKLTKDYIIIC